MWFVYVRGINVYAAFSVIKQIPHHLWWYDLLYLDVCKYFC